jgi:hypothetical protein
MNKNRMRALIGKPHKSGLFVMFMYIRIGGLSIRSKFEKKERATSTTTESSMHIFFNGTSNEIHIQSSSTHAHAELDKIALEIKQTAQNALRQMSLFQCSR